MTVPNDNRTQSLLGWHRRLRRFAGYAAVAFFAVTVVSFIRALVTRSDYFDAPAALIAADAIALAATALPILVDRVEVQPRILRTAHTQARELVLLRRHQWLMRLLIVCVAYVVALPALLDWATGHGVLERDWVDSDGSLMLFFGAAAVIVVLFCIDLAVVRRMSRRTIRAATELDE